MDTITPGLETLPAAPKQQRRRHSLSQKQKIVAETFGDASVSKVARRYDVNANQLFLWRKQYLDGKLGSPALLPVEVVLPEAPTTFRQVLEIDLGGAKQLRALFDCPPELLRAAIEAML